MDGETSTQGSASRIGVNLSDVMIPVGDQFE